jgi:hypothetical protein
VSAVARLARPDLGEAVDCLSVGDLVRTGANLHPHYRVIAITDDRAWIRDVQSGADHVVPIARCGKIMGRP